MGTTAKIAALNKTDHTGITPDLAKNMWHSLGSQHIALVGFRVTERTEGEEDNHGVKLEITYVEPSDDEDTTEYLRELQRALYRKRNPQPALTAGDSTEPGVDGLLIQGQTFLKCPNCNGHWKDPNLAHAPGSVDDGYPPCSYKQCGHATHDGLTDCPHDHDNTAAA